MDVDQKHQLWNFKQGQKAWILVVNFGKEHLLLQPIWANYVICGRAFYSLPKSAVTAISPQELAFTAILGNDFCKAIG